MSGTPPFDSTAAHRWFAAEYFNRTWDLLDKPDRTPEEDERMVSFCHASIAHWQDGADCQPRNLSIGYWQLSRVLATLGQGQNAGHYGRLCLAASTAEPPFYLGYAYEALARAAAVSGDHAAAREHLDKASRLAAQVAKEEDQKALEEDLTTIVNMFKRT
jgi:hypothetical protein